MITKTRIRIGISTKKDVEDAYGTPRLIGRRQDGKARYEEWIYPYNTAYFENGVLTGFKY